PKRVAAWQSLIWAKDTLWELLVVGAMAYWWLIERTEALVRVTLLCPAPARDRIRSFIEEAETRLGAFVRGQLIICAVVGVAAFAAYLVLGVPSPLALAGLAAVAELVPVIGPPVAIAAAVVSAPN